MKSLEKIRAKLDKLSSTLDEVEEICKDIDDADDAFAARHDTHDITILEDGIIRLWSDDLGGWLSYEKHVSDAVDWMLQVAIDNGPGDESGKELLELAKSLESSAGKIRDYVKDFTSAGNGIAR